MSKKIIVDALSEVSCPHCDQAFVLQDAIARHLIEHYESEYADMLDAERQRLSKSVAAEAERSVARRYEDQLAGLKEKLTASDEDKTRLQTRLERVARQSEERGRAEIAEQLAAVKVELAAKEERLASTRQNELALRKEKAALEEREKERALEMQRRVDELRKQVENESAETYRLREAEWRKKIGDAQKANDDLKRKLEQGSQQLQGEVLELEIEDLLGSAFPFDSIEAVRKGVRGADVIQVVRTRSGVECGRIVWETKRAEHWSNVWVGKLKDDQQTAGGELAVLVSTAFPADVCEAMSVYEGIWLVRPELARGLAEALRTVLIESQRQKAISAGRSESAEALYGYITSAAFAQKIRSTVETYQQMRQDLEKEKAAMQRLWKKREMQIERVSAGILGICGELQGVSQESLPQLEDIGLLPS